MTKRYTTTASLFFTEWGAAATAATAATVIVEDEKVRATGLVDQFGVTICSYDEKRPVGFIPRVDRTKA